MTNSRSFISTDGHGLADAVLVADEAKRLNIIIILGLDSLDIRFPDGVLLTVQPVLLGQGQLALGWNIKKP